MPTAHRRTNIVEKTLTASYFISPAGRGNLWHVSVQCTYCTFEITPWKMPPNSLLALIFKANVHSHTSGYKRGEKRVKSECTHRYADTHTQRKDQWGVQAHLAVYSEWDVNVPLTLPPRDPTVIKALSETWLLCSLWKSAQKNITAGGDTDVLIALLVCAGRRMHREAYILFYYFVTASVYVLACFGILSGIYTVCLGLWVCIQYMCVHMLSG